MLAPLLLACLAPLASPADVPVLRLGETIEDVIEDGDKVVHTPILDEYYSEAPTVGKIFLVKVERSGSYHVEMRSWAFDSYLVLRDIRAGVQFEEDSGPVGDHSLLELPRLEAGKTYFLKACALRGDRGHFELVLRRGIPRPLSLEVKASARIADQARHVEVLEKTDGPESETLVDELLRLGYQLKRQGRLAEARSLLERALAIQQRVHGPDHLDVAYGFNRLAELLHEQGDLVSAEPLYERALAVFEKTDHPWTATTLNLARLLWDKGEIDGARNLLSTSTAGWRARLPKWLERLPEASSVLFLRGERWKLELQLSFAISGTPEFLAEAYESLLAWKGQVTRASAARREWLVGENSDEQQGLLEDLRALRAEVSLMLAKGPQERSKRYGILGNKRRLERELVDAIGGQIHYELSLAEIRKALPPRSAILDIFVQRLYQPGTWEEESLVRGSSWSEEHAIAWVVRPVDKEPKLACVDLGPVAALESACWAFLDDLVTGRECNSQLRKLLWDPVAAHIEGVETLFVSPDTFLGTLPLDALALDDGTFLTEHMGFVYLQDTASLVRREDKPRPAYDMLLSVGSVKHESSDVSDIHRDAFGDRAGRLELLAPEATEERLRHELGCHSVLHLGRDAFFRHAEPQSGSEANGLVAWYPGLLSGLLCEGTEHAPEEGREHSYLTADELGWLDLTNVEVVVMSGSETRLDRPRSGEGLIGLRRAFHVAGAKTVISSLWQVNDESTSKLMRDFYKNLWLKGMGRLEALRSAQLAMLNKNRMEHGDPLPSTWGAFVLSGEWR